MDLIQRTVYDEGDEEAPNVPAAVKNLAVLIAKQGYTTTKVKLLDWKNKAKVGVIAEQYYYYRPYKDFNGEIGEKDAKYDKFDAVPIEEDPDHASADRLVVVNDTTMYYWDHSDNLVKITL